MKKQIAGLLVIALLSPAGVATPVWAQQSDPAAQAASTAHGAVADSKTQPAANAEIAAESYPDAPTPAQTQDSQQSVPASSSSSQATSGTQPSAPQKPVGTAAAPYEKTTGVAASRPAGAVIAPAKQRRMRAIFISVGVIVAAGVATGAVVGLSHSSPSRP